MNSNKSVISGMFAKAVLGVSPVLMMPFSFCGYALFEPKPGYERPVTSKEMLNEERRNTEK